MRRLLLLVSAVVLVETMFFAALTPLLPDLAADLGLSKAGAGVLAAAYPVGVGLGALPSGVLATRFGVKPTVLLGLVGLAVSSAAFGLADTAWALDLARFVQGLAGACSWTGALAWLVAASPPDRRGQLLGTAVAAAVVGALLGPVLGGVAALAGTAVAFLGVAALAGVLAVWALAAPTPAAEAPGRVGTVLRAAADPAVAQALWLIALPGLGFGVLSVLGPLALSDLGLGAAAVGAVFLVSASFEAVLGPVLGRVSDRVGRLRPLRVGLAAAAVAVVVFPWTAGTWLLLPAVLAVGASFGSFWAPAMSLLSDRADARAVPQGFGFALMNLAWAPGQAAGAAVGGALAEATADAVPFTLVGVACLVSFAVLARTVRGERPVPDLV